MKQQPNPPEGSPTFPTFPGFPVEIGGVAELHAAFREESRTRGCVPGPRNRKSGFAPAYVGRNRWGEAL